MFQLFGLLSGLLPLLGALPYGRDMVKRKTNPHRGSFLIWTILGAIAFFSQLAKGATWSLFLPAADTLATVSIFILSLRFGSGGLNKRDVGGLFLAASGLVLWHFSNQPLVALLSVIGVDAIGTVLTVVKTYEFPQSETFSSWLLASLGGLFAALAVGKLSFALLAYPLYIFAANGSVNFAMLISPRKHSDKE